MTKKVISGFGKEDIVKIVKNKKKQLPTFLLKFWRIDELAHIYIKEIIIIYEDKT